MSSLVVGMRFERQRVVVSGRRFERCSFAGCELVFDGRPVQLVDNSFEGCVWAFEGPAGVTVEFLTALCRYDAEVRTMLASQLGLLEEADPDAMPQPPKPARRPRTRAAGRPKGGLEGTERTAPH